MTDPPAPTRGDLTRRGLLGSAVLAAGAAATAVPTTAAAAPPEATPPETAPLGAAPPEDEATYWDPRVKPLLARMTLPEKIAPGETTTAVITLSPRELALVDGRMRTVVEPGVFDVLVGRSCHAIELTARLEVTA
ncbi:fibronectin type III-like domain-contianing protein [Streptomyces sp. NPDC126522]|uniref:fibronectin type III-like domain-contianing protein n=1 Tax=Streptomyces sp. NPDC126522 TaxID=3155211 RepID=UPI00332BE9B2